VSNSADVPADSPGGPPASSQVGPFDVAETIAIAVTPERVYDAIADVRRMAKWSPECFAVWVYRRQGGQPARFVGFNRRTPFVWFTTCVVRVAEPGREFAFDVSTFGMPVSRWTYRLAPTPDGGTEVTELWHDRRVTGATVLGLIFTGARTTRRRPEVNREGMQTTLRRLKAELESAA
jgi:uncharacterized protein YndB with AHSA1/START domain